MRVEGRSERRLGSGTEIVEVSPTNCLIASNLPIRGYLSAIIRGVGILGAAILV